ncbi:hypothetical protein [Nocardia ninae]|uniref:Uncharacterized protein n=1 Tax=Nocardia ninae NBRC 108245 TaxID=1210091 RepID=A0A511MNJ5_9NOCA|nr:hypothetical protein [Nocardia ninae]GEM42185.1 hypothetical protein NN4_67040 [Nocardia ninae NBRC 108245]
MPDEGRADNGQPPVHPSSPWTWPAVTLTCFLVLCGLVTVSILIADGIAPAAAATVTLVLVAGIVACVVPTRSGDSIGRKMIRALSVLANGGNEPR